MARLNLKNESVRYGGVLALCVILSGGAIVYCAVKNHPSEAGRGGAVAVALAFFVLFLSRGYGSKAFTEMVSKVKRVEERLRRIEGKSELPEDTPGVVAGAAEATRVAAEKKIEDRLKTVETDISNLQAALQTSQNLTDASTMRQNLFLATSSVVGTLAWGFGDWAAKWIQVIFHLA